MRKVIVTIVLGIGVLWGVTLWLLREPLGVPAAVSESAPPMPAIAPVAPSYTRGNEAKPVERSSTSEPSPARTLTPPPGGVVAIDPFAEGGPAPVIVVPGTGARAPRSPSNSEDVHSAPPQ
ncbi:MAG: hypothetical protein ABJC33_08455 [Betaproteobacteria bacterium]